MNTFNDPRTVIQTVAYLMACRLTAYRQSLMLHLPEDRAAVQRLSEKELFEQLISKPLSLSVNGNHERMVILLDGLDECGSPENNVLAKTLYEFADSLPDWLRILIVARDIPAISVYTKGHIASRSAAKARAIWRTSGRTIGLSWNRSSGTTRNWPTRWSE